MAGWGRRVQAAMRHQLPSGSRQFPDIRFGAIRLVGRDGLAKQNKVVDLDVA